jgi:hypothetical protein
MRNQSNAPKHVTWVICLILFLFAVLSHFGYIHFGREYKDWAWIVGFALLLLAVRVRGL